MSAHVEKCLVEIHSGVQTHRHGESPGTPHAGAAVSDHMTPSSQPRPDVGVESECRRKVRRRQIAHREPQRGRRLAQPLHVEGKSIGDLVLFDQTHHVDVGRRATDAGEEGDGIGTDRVFATEQERPRDVERNAMHSPVEIHRDRRSTSPN